MDQSRVSRLTQELCELGLLERVERGPFRTGPRFFSLGGSLQHWLGARSQEPNWRLWWPRSASGPGSPSVTASGSSCCGRPAMTRAPGQLCEARHGDPGLVHRFRPGAALGPRAAEPLRTCFSEVNFIGVGGPGAAHSPAGGLRIDGPGQGPRGFIGRQKSSSTAVYELAVPVRTAGGDRSCRP